MNKISKEQRKKKTRQPQKAQVAQRDQGSVTILSTLLFLIISFSIITAVSGPTISNYKIGRAILESSINKITLESNNEELIYGSEFNLEPIDSGDESGDSEEFVEIN